MKKTTNRLVLAKETVRKLLGREMANVSGGTAPAIGRKLSATGAWPRW